MRRNVRATKREKVKILTRVATLKMPPARACESSSRDLEICKLAMIYMASLQALKMRASTGSGQ
jgi:hypothetical protein